MPENIDRRLSLETGFNFITYNDQPIVSINSVIAEQTTKYSRLYGLTPDEAAGARRYIDGIGVTPTYYENKHILDAGSGSGSFKNALSKMGINTSVINLDDGEMYPVTNTDIIGKIEQIPLPDNTFDLVVAHSTFPWDINNSTDLTYSVKQLQELVRVTKHGGVVIYTPLRIFDATDTPHTQELWDTIAQNALNSLQEMQQQNPNMKIKITQQIYGQNEYYELAEIIK